MVTLRCEVPNHDLPTKPIFYLFSLPQPQQDFRLDLICHLRGPHCDWLRFALINCHTQSLATASTHQSCV